MIASWLHAAAGMVGAPVTAEGPVDRRRAKLPKAMAAAAAAVVATIRAPRRQAIQVVLGRLAS